MINILKNTMKKIAAIAMVAVMLLALPACSDMLDKQPLGKLNESVFTTKSTIDKLLIACYSALNGVIQGTGGWSTSPDNMYYGDMCSGNIHKGSNPTDQGGLFDMERYVASTNNGILNDKWVVMYGAIDRCNDVLRTLNANEISDLSDADKTEIIAEVRFLRAYYHFETKKVWNMVPYIDETVEDQQRRVANDRDIWPDIEADLTFAMNNLATTQEEPGRPTNWAAKALLAKAHMYQKDYTAAKPLLDDIITNGSYQLLPNFYDNFNADWNNNIEAIWQNQVAVNIPGIGFDRSQRGGDLAYPGGSNVPKNLSGAGFNQPTFDLVNAYKTDANGLPLIDTYFESDFHHDFGIESDNEEIRPGDLTDEFTPDMTTLVDPRLDWTVGRRGIPFHDWGVHPGKDWIRDQPTAGPYNIKKMILRQDQVPTYAHESSAKFNAMNFSIIRYASILMWAAECEIEIGDPETARKYVNMIRARARDGIYVRLGDDAPFGNGPLAANYKVGEYTESWAAQTKEWMRKRVYFESRLEFAEEGQYFFDLVRWGVAKEYINAYVAREKEKIQYLNGVVFEDTDCYFPIPLTQIDRSYVDGQPTLTQNPGY